jgi:hypothetical protein
MKQVNGLGAGVLVGVSLIANVARAEEPAANKALAPSAEVSTPPVASSSDTDVVRLKNGGLVRGKISELLPNDSVTIVTVTGRTREFPMAEVEYAGPAAQDPKQADASASGTDAPATTNDHFGGNTGGDSSNKAADPAKPYITVHGREARLHLISNEAGITFHRQSGSAMAVGSRGSAVVTGYDRICTAPCDVSLPAGTETLALSRGDKAPIEAEASTLPPGPSEVRGTIESRAGIRVAGWVIAIGSAVAGAALMLTASDKENQCDAGYCRDVDKLDNGKMLGGVVVLAVGAGVGVAMGLVNDKAVIDVKPQGGAVSHSTWVARGVSFHGSF